MLAVVITAASVQDRDAARLLLWNLSRCCTRVRLAWADAGYADKLAAWAAQPKIRLEIGRKRDAHASASMTQPKRRTAPMPTQISAVAQASTAYYR